MFRQATASLGAALLAAVAIMDPGSLGTAIVGGSHYGLGLVPVLLVSWLAAVWLQDRLANRALEDGLDLRARKFLAGSLLVVGLATSLGELSGGIEGLRLLTGMSQTWATLIFPWLGGLLLYRRNRRSLLIGVSGLLLLMGLAFLAELVRTGGQPGLGSPLGPEAPQALYLSLALFGTTVQPMALYLREATDQNRGAGHRRATRAAFGLGLAINLAVFWLAATLFFPRGLAVTDWATASRTLEPLLGGAAPRLFALALTVSGLAAAAVTGGLSTLAGLAHLLGRPALARPGLRLFFLPVLALPLLLDQKPMAILILSQATVGLGTPLLLWPVLGRRFRSESRSPVSYPETRPRSGYLPEPDPAADVTGLKDRRSAGRP